MEVAEILLGMRAAEEAEGVSRGELDVPELATEAGRSDTPARPGGQVTADVEGGWAYEEAFSFGNIDEPIVGDNYSFTRSYPSNSLAELHRLTESRVRSLALARYVSPSLHSSSRSSAGRGASRRGTPFPV